MVWFEQNIFANHPRLGIRAWVSKCNKHDTNNLKNKLFGESGGDVRYKSQESRVKSQESRVKSRESRQNTRVIARYEAIPKLYRGVLHGVYPLLAAGGPVTFVATKVTKKAVSRNASLPHEPLPCKSARTTGY